MSRVQQSVLCVAMALSCAASFAQTNPPDVAKVAIAPTGSLPNLATNVSPVTQAHLLKPAGQAWLGYHGDYSGRHHSDVDQINLRNVNQLRRAWISETNPQYTGNQRIGGPAGTARPLPEGPGRTGSGTAAAGMRAIRSIPLYHDGALFYTLGQNAYAVDARTGRRRWRQFIELDNRYIDSDVSLCAGLRRFCRQQP